MALEINELKRAPSGAMYVSPTRICVTADGRITDQDDPAAVRLLVAEGGEIPASEAAVYGLIADEALAADREPAPSAEATDEEEKPKGKK